MDEGHIVVDSIASIEREDITDDLARESGFRDAKDLLETAIHGGGHNVYLIRFHYLPADAWNAETKTHVPREDRPTLLQRIRRSAAPVSRSNRK
jgi:hypothetical protein